MSQGHLFSWQAQMKKSVNPCPAELIKKPHPFLIFSQSDYLMKVFDTDSHTLWQTVQIQISWLLKKPTDLDLHCLQGRVHLGSAGQGLTFTTLLVNSANDISIIFFLIFPRKLALILHANCLLRRQFYMKCQSVFSGEKKKIQNVVCWNFYPEC